MNRREMASLFVASCVFIPQSHDESQLANCESHVAWVVEILKKMSSIKVGSSSSDLYKIFRPEGGLSTELHRTFASRDCPYFKIDVGWSDDTSALDSKNREDAKVVRTITKPYLEFGHYD